MDLRLPPAGWVDLLEVPGLRFDLRYASNDNVTGRPLPGYGAAGAWLRADAATALARVTQSLAADGWGVTVFDAYRPYRATLALVRWAEATGRGDLVARGLLARRSEHNAAAAVDVALCDLQTRALLDHGGAFDDFGPTAHPLGASGSGRALRQRLAAEFERAGFVPSTTEWWHMGWPQRGEPLDIPYGAEEADDAPARAAIPA